ncbi:hypothetical protein [Mycobacterium sp. MMS18-G62]
MKTIGSVDAENAERLNKVWFLTPVPSGLADAVRAGEDAVTVTVTVRHTVEVDRPEKPAAVAELLARYVF